MAKDALEQAVAIVQSDGDLIQWSCKVMKYSVKAAAAIIDH